MQPFLFLEKTKRVAFCGAMVTSVPQLHSTKPELRLCADSDTVRGVSEIFFVTMVMARNKTYRLTSVNYSTKTFIISSSSSFREPS